MTPRSLALAAALLGLAAPAAAQTDPTADVQALRQCLADADRDPDAERACAGAQAMLCLDRPENATTLAMGDCLSAEAAAWDRVLNELFGDLVVLSRQRTGQDEATGDAPIPYERLLRDAQRAWIGFRDADCAQEVALWGEGTMRTVAAAQCALDRTSDRALELLSKRRAFENP